MEQIEWTALPPTDDERLINNGYEPLAAEGKRPVGEAWQSRANTCEAAAAEREAFPNATNTGLRTGRLVGIDVDVIDPAHAAAISKMITDFLGATLFRRVGSKGEMLCYRNETPIPKLSVTYNDNGQRRPLVEFLGKGQQFIAFGTHPDTGKPYAWRGPTPLTTPIAHLPAVTAKQLQKCAELVAELGDKLGYQNVQFSGTPREAVTPISLAEREPISWQDAVRLLSYLNPGCNYDTWIKTLAAIKGTALMSGDAEDLACRWSRGELWTGEPPTNYTDDEAITERWEGLRGDPGVATLRYLARQEGATFGSDPASYGEPPSFDVDASAPVRVRLLRGDRMKPKAVEWLWPGWLARGKFHLLAGQPGDGKSTITLALAAAVTTGGTWPDGTAVGEPGDVLIWSSEDDFEDTILPRFLAAGGDGSRLHLIDRVEIDGQPPRAFNPATDIAKLQEAIATLSNPRVLIVDPAIVDIATEIERDGNDPRRSDAASRPRRTLSGRCPRDNAFQ